MLKLAQILEQSSGTRQAFVSVFFLFWSLYKTNRFHVAVGLFSNRSQRTSKCGKNIRDTLRLRLVCHFIVFTTFWRHLWSITEQRHGNMESIFFSIVKVKLFSLRQLHQPETRLLDGEKWAAQFPGSVSSPGYLYAPAILRTSPGENSVGIETPSTLFLLRSLIPSFKCTCTCL